MDELKLINGSQQTIYHTVEDEVLNDTNPEDDASFLSKMFLWWLTPILKKVYKTKSFSLLELYPVRTKYRSSSIFDKFSQHWKANGQRSLLWTLAIMFYPFIIEFLILGNIMCFLVMLNAYLIGILTGYFNNSDSTRGIDAYLVAAGIIVIVFVYSMMKTTALYDGKRFGMLLRITLGTAVYNNVLNLPINVIQSYGSGNIMTFMATDLDLLAEAPRLMEIASASIPATAVLIWLVYREMGTSCLLALLYPIGSFIVLIMSRSLTVKLRGMVAEKTAKRIQMMMNIIHNMETIKIYCWETPFGNILNSLRRSEIVKITYTFCVGAIVMVQSQSVPGVTMAIVITISLNGGHQLHPQSFIRSLGYIYLFGWIIGASGMFGLSAFQGYKSIKRIEKFLKEEVHKSNKSEISPSLYDIKCKDLSASWDFHSSSKGSNQLEDISFNLKKGDLMIVSGPTGSGKTALLLTLLGHLNETAGSKYITDSIAYCPQQPWIFSGTIKENILFGMTLDSQYYYEVVKACCLISDIEEFPQGDDTLIGDRGITLSGGQKARISLARAVYQNKNLLLLDDPLSAVDAKVGKHIFEKCIKGLLSEKTVLLVTHQANVIPTADFVLILNKKGRVEHCGPHHVNVSVNWTDSYKAGGSAVATHGITDQMEAHEDKDHHQTGYNSSSTIRRNFLNEDSEQGEISWNVYKHFFRAGKGWATFVPLIIIGILGHATLKYADWFLSSRIKENQNLTAVEFPVEKEPINASRNIQIYAALVVGYIVCMGLFLLLSAVFIITAAKNLHEQMFRYVLNAKMSFFNKPLGIIINRFSRDLGVVDSLIYFDMYRFLYFLFMIFAILGMSCVVFPWLLFGFVPLALSVIFLYKFSLRASQEFRRLEAVARTPVFSATSNALEGRMVISAMRREDHFLSEFHDNQDRHTSAYNLYISTLSWLSLYISLLCVFYFLLVIILSFSLKGHGTISAFIILLVSQTFDPIQLCGLYFTQLNIMMTSVERVLSYIKTPQEEHTNVELKAISTHWPKTTKICFQNVSLQYEGSSTWALKNVSFLIHKGEKIGVIGRTGSGKSSIFRALTRLASYNGIITIDDIDISTIPRKTLRKAISFIPQDPVLFNGTLRENLDPFCEVEDIEIWAALEHVQLLEFVRCLPQQLDTTLGEGFRDLSAGQKQLLSLARALLKKAKIVIMDEATANVDMRTDEVIQSTIRDRFSDCTLLTIAHRIHTVQKYDKIMVVSGGSITKFDTPEVVLR